jgi:hypothetical protein
MCAARPPTATTAVIASDARDTMDGRKRVFAQADVEHTGWPMTNDDYRPARRRCEGQR